MPCPAVPMDQITDIAAQAAPMLQEFLQSLLSPDFFLVMISVFAFCEALFQTGYIEQNRWKKAVAVVSGLVLGLLLFPYDRWEIAMAHGMIAGWLTTSAVEKLRGSQRSS